MTEEEKEIFELIWINIDPEDRYYSFEQGVKAMDQVRTEMPGLFIEGLENFVNFGYGQMEMFKITGKPDDVHYVEERYYELCREISEAEYD